MIRSMTAYGRDRQTVGKLDIQVEIRSVNNRYFDCAVRLPRQYAYMEEKIKSFLVANGISRGKLDVSVSVASTAAEGVEVRLDEAYAQQYYSALSQLADRFSLPHEDITLSLLAANRELFCEVKPQADDEQDYEAVRTVLAGALAAFLRAREAEGARMAADITAKRERFASFLPQIEALAAACGEKYRIRLETRIRSLLAEYGASADDGRILTEVGIYADHAAIDEETVRLRSHLEAFDEMLGCDTPVGRKLDFLLQEMNRETNTIGSKADELAITKMVIEMKSELEKIREQIQNIE